MAVESFTRNRTKESVGIFSLLEKEWMWRGGHKSAVKLTLAPYDFCLAARPYLIVAADPFFDDRRAEIVLRAIGFLRRMFAENSWWPMDS